MSDVLAVGLERSGTDYAILFRQFTVTLFALFPFLIRMKFIHGDQIAGLGTVFLPPPYSARGHELFGADETRLRLSVLFALVLEPDALPSVHAVLVPDFPELFGTRSGTAIRGGLPRNKLFSADETFFLGGHTDSAWLMPYQYGPHYIFCQGTFLA